MTFSKEIVSEKVGMMSGVINGPRRISSFLNLSGWKAVGEKPLLAFLHSPVHGTACQSDKDSLSMITNFAMYTLK